MKSTMMIEFRVTMPASAIIPMNAGPEKKTGFLKPPIWCGPIWFSSQNPGSTPITMSGMARMIVSGSR